MGCCGDNNVAGSSNRRRKRNNVAGISDDNFRVPVKSFIDSDDFCRAVNRCLLDDLVAGAEDDNRRRRRRKGHSWDSWF
ncbi:hypothetical protein [Halobacillus campisalis]|uniref:Uncharacterized protein n=1 Tax=Halobacillus campisalis TaxID=435909 RepID=A0ABW2K3J2_9BACI|nr:hypothetical protein [Halobacillus campisalis]